MGRDQAYIFATNGTCMLCELLARPVGRYSGGGGQLEICGKVQGSGVVGPCTVMGGAVTTCRHRHLTSE